MVGSTGMRMAVLAAVLAAGVVPSYADDWPFHGGDSGGQKFSPLTAITRSNVASLRPAWTYHTGDAAVRPAAGQPATFEATPILTPAEAGRSLVFCTPSNRVIALDPATGRERWVFDPEAGLPAYLLACRGVAHWRDPAAATGSECAHRLLFGTQDMRLWAIDAATGRPCPGFGIDGAVALESGQQAVPGEIEVRSPPVVVNGVVVVGSSIRDNVRLNTPKGIVQAFDAVTGRPLWQFDPIARDPADPASASWIGGAGTIGGGNVWSLMSADPERSLVFLPTSSPSGDNYGGSRTGDNLYTSSVVALHAATGKVAWHRQIVHHDLWDYDVPSQPVLTTLTPTGKSAGRQVAALVVTTKQGLIFQFDRETGEPLDPIDERPVPQGAAPGEWLSPTQPFPRAMPPLGPLRLDPDDAWGVLWFDKIACRRKIAAARSEGIYTPPSFQGSIAFPSPLGGTNWGGGAVDPQRHVMVVNSTRVAGLWRLVERTKDSPTEFRQDTVQSAFFPMPDARYATQFEALTSPLGMPCNPPPWGVLSAVDLVAKKILWEVPFGTLDRMLPFNLGITPGMPSLGGPLLTASGLVFIAAAMDDRIRAFDVASGEELWRADLPAGGQATPMTYQVDGRQFVVIAAGGHPALGTTPGDAVVAFALPDVGK